MKRSLSLLLYLTLAGCGGVPAALPHPVPGWDAGPGTHPQDAGLPSDAGLDAGVERDAGQVMDAGTPDAGEVSNCGGHYASCCPGETCQSAQDRCEPTVSLCCGATGATCCPAGRACTQGGAVCDTSRVCLTCGYTEPDGTPGPCCPGDTCASGRTCLNTLQGLACVACVGGDCSGCGESGQSCCPSQSCKGSLTCTRLPQGDRCQ